MERVVTATEARVRFGEMMRRAVENREPIIVERSGKPYVVVLSVEEYDRLRDGRTRESWKETLDRILQLGDEIARRRGGKPLPPPDEMIHEAREERDARIAGMR